MRARPLVLASLVVVVAAPAVAWAQVAGLGQAEGSIGPRPPVLGDEAERSLRGRFGPGVAERLLTSNDDSEPAKLDRLRGIARAASDGSTEGVALLTAIPDKVRSDPRATIELARAFSSFVDQEPVRTKLLDMVKSSHTQDADPAKRDLARAIAAMALAASGDAKAADELVKLVRASGPGQEVAAAALAAYPEHASPYTTKQDAPLSPTGALAYASSGDLRLLEALRNATRPGDAQTRAAALVALGHMGDQRALEIAKAMFGDSDARLRVAAGETMVLLDAPERFRAVEVLLADPTTAAAGVQLAERAQDAGIVRALVARMAALGDPTIREAVVAALGRGTTDDALKALVALLSDARLGAAAAQAIARSPHAGAMGAIERMADKRLAIRAYVLRRAIRGETSSAMDDAILTMGRSKDGKDRALGTFARVAFDKGALASGLADPDPRVRRMAGLAASWQPSVDTQRAVLRALGAEKDEPTRTALALALASGDPDALVPSLVLVDRAESGGADAPLSALALAARARQEDESLREKIATLLASKDATIRAHVARGLALSPAHDATGQLAEAYRYETDVVVRRAIVLALGARDDDENAPVRKWALGTAAKLDPDPVVRLTARRAIAGLRAAPDPVVREVAWVRAVSAEGSTAPRDLEASYVGADGLAVPFVLDDDGFALVLGVAPGEGRLVLAPRIP